MSGHALPLDAGLRRRFLDASAEIAWRDAEASRARPRQAAAARARIAHLHDEEARVEESGRGRRVTLVVDSGPVGALVVLTEIDRRGLPGLLTTHEAGELPEFPQGALEARWGSIPTKGAPALPLRDLVELARYALA